MTREQVASIRIPTLVAIGTRDLVAGSPDRLVALMPNARSLPIPDRDHMIAVGDKVYKAGVLEFLAERP
jgi:pimeloyl-ACP methyl ester carboxylesterase